MIPTLSNQEEKNRYSNFFNTLATGAVISICIIAFGPFIIWGILGIPDTVRNNRQLTIFANNVYRFPLPQQTELINKRVYVTLVGNSNHCDFIVELTLTTSLTREEIGAYYEGVTFPPVREEPQGWEDTYPSGIHEPITPVLEFSEVVSNNKDLDLTLVVLDFGYPPGLDYRCH